MAASDYKRVELSAEHAKLWQETRVALSWHCPAFTHIFMTMLDTTGHKDIAYFSRDIPIACTDGESLVLNPDEFFKFTLLKRVFIVAHEILHCVLNDCILIHFWTKDGCVKYQDGTKLPYVHSIMNFALDYRINDILVDAKVGEFDKDWLHNPAIGTKDESGADIYRKLYNMMKKLSGGAPAPGEGNTSQGNPPPGEGKSFDKLLPPGTMRAEPTAPEQAATERSDQKWEAAIAAAQNLNREQGNKAAGLERLFHELLAPKVDWTDMLKATMARRLGSDRYDWQKADRRLIVRDIFAPSRSGFGTGTVIVAGDTSGSIGDKEISMFFAELVGILENVRPKELIVVWCDAAVHRVDYCEEVGDLMQAHGKGAPGGGGTDFRPVFEWVAANEKQPEALIYLTDGMGTFPEHAPDYPVIWGSIYPDSQYPFGDVVPVPHQA